MERWKKKKDTLAVCGWALTILYIERLKAVSGDYQK